jgi:hypothetical protein
MTACGAEGSRPSGGGARRPNFGSCRSAWQRPPRQRQPPPPQSKVPARHSIEQSTARQSGFCAAATHELGWQQSAGTQSASLAQTAPAPPPGLAGPGPLETGVAEGPGASVVGRGEGSGRSPVLVVQAAISKHARGKSVVRIGMA